MLGVCVSGVCVCIDNVTCSCLRLRVEPSVRCSHASEQDSGAYTGESLSAHSP